MDESPKKRPNANYNLSKPDNADPKEENLTFYYNRERRLAKAPELVQNRYNKEPANNKPGLLQSLIGGRARATFFFSIIVLCALIMMLAANGYFDKSYTLEGNKLEISGIKYEGAVIALIKKSAQSKAYTGTVDIAVSPPAETDDEQYQVFYHRVFFSMEPEEEYRFAIPFDAPEILMVIQTEKSELKIKIVPE